ncbi:hypothetical protein MmTuc01_2613 [Methanosarcina mazei Tuc01]|uniref:Uncharacterized protein n=1 Tax=Methanosarcina mazei Tuc01 TaxID=1236903 RepID=M1PBK0_METMZ|nr:hypothetical protein MmTuc01_2613 [Methanosarcina mazei Tuc01]
MLRESFTNLIPAKFPVPGYAIIEKGGTMFSHIHLFPAG